MPAILCREKEHESLCSFLYQRWIGLHSKAIFLFGSPGSGKTKTINSLEAPDVTSFPTDYPSKFNQLLAGSAAAQNLSENTDYESLSVSTKKTVNEGVKFCRVNCANLSAESLRAAIIEEVDRATAKWKLSSSSSLGLSERNANASNSGGSGLTEKAKKSIEAVQSRVRALSSTRVPAVSKRKLVVLALDEVDFTNKKGAAQEVASVILANSKQFVYCALVLVLISNGREKIVETREHIDELAFPPYTQEQSKKLLMLQKAVAGGDPRLATATCSTTVKSDEEVLGGGVKKGRGRPKKNQSLNNLVPTEQQQPTAVFDKAALDLMAKQNHEGDARKLKDVANAAERKAVERHEKKKEKEQAAAAAEAVTKTKRGKRGRETEEEEAAKKPTKSKASKAVLEELVPVQACDVVAANKNGSHFDMIQLLTSDQLLVLCCCLKCVKDRTIQSGLSGTMPSKTLREQEIWEHIVQLMKHLGTVHQTPSRGMITSHISALSDAALISAMDGRGCFQLMMDEADLLAGLHALEAKGPVHRAAIQLYQL